jgi:hypothetical protein
MVTELMLRVWGEQACQNPADWPRVLKGLFADARSSRDNAPVRASYQHRFDQAVDAITSALAESIPQNLQLVIWRAFSPLDRDHRHQLAALLIEAAAYG